MSSHGGLNFYIGNNPDADGTYHAPPGVTPSIEGQIRDTRRVAEAAAGRPLTDAEVSDHFYRQAWRWIRDRPGDAIALFVRKAALTFHSSDIPLNYSYAYWSRDEPTLLRALLVGPWLLVPCGIAGFVVPRAADRRAFLSWAAFIPAYALSLAVFFVVSRYRLPLLVALCVTSGGAVSWAVGALAERRTAGARRVAAAAALAAVVAFWPFAIDEGLANERTERLVHLIVEGRPDEARALFDRTVPIHRDPGMLNFRVGRAWLDAGRPDLAVGHFEKSLAAAPGQGEVHLVLGQALLRLQRPADAVGHLERARAADVFADVAGLELARALVSLGRRDEARAAVASTPMLEDTDAPTALGARGPGVPARRSGDGPPLPARRPCAAPRRWRLPTRASASRSSGWAAPTKPSRRWRRLAAWTPPTRRRPSTSRSCTRARDDWRTRVAWRSVPWTSIPPRPIPARCSKSCPARERPPAPRRMCKRLNIDTCVCPMIC